MWRLRNYGDDQNTLFCTSLITIALTGSAEQCLETVTIQTNLVQFVHYIKFECLNIKQHPVLVASVFDLISHQEPENLFLAVFAHYTDYLFHYLLLV